MNNSKSLSSDIDFIKEFEELKIKQKLLVETLNKKKGALRDEHLININSKLDFLVTLFKDANDTSDSDPHKELVDLMNSLSLKIDTLEKSFEDKILEIEKKIEETSKASLSNQVDSKNNEAKAKNENKEVELDYSDIKKNLVHHETKGIKESVLEEKEDNSTPPKPDFKVSENLEVEEKISNLDNKQVEEKKEKKKFKWF